VSSSEALTPPMTEPVARAHLDLVRRVNPAAAF
jgi:hypothetical protein